VSLLRFHYAASYCFSLHGTVSVLFVAGLEGDFRYFAQLIVTGADEPAKETFTNIRARSYISDKITIVY
jgi:hypothetical protein